MRQSERVEYDRTIDHRVGADAEPKPIPIGAAMLRIFLLTIGLWAVIWALFATMSQ